MGNTRGTIHVDKPLSNFSLRYSNGALIADSVFPRIDVEKESDKYFLYGKQDFNTSNDFRSDKADVNFADSWKIDSTPTYTCEEHSLADLVSDRERKNADAPLAPDFDTTESLTNMIMLNREKRLVDIVCATSSYATSGNTVTKAGATQWNNGSFAGSIEADIDVAKEAIRAYIGREPNTIIIPSAVAKVVKRNSTVRDQIKYTHNDILINGDLPPVLYNLKVFIPGAIYNTANPGQTFSGSDVWGKDVVVCYLAPNPRTPRTMTFGLTFQSQPRQVAKWREDKKKSDAIEVSEILVEKLVSEYCGYLIKSAIA